MIYNTICKTFTLLDIKNCIYFCIYEVFQIYRLCDTLTSMCPRNV